MNGNKLKKIINTLIDEKSSKEEIKLIEKINIIIDALYENDKEKDNKFRMLKSNLDLSHLEKIGTEITENYPQFTRKCFCGRNEDGICDCEPFQNLKNNGNK